MGYLSFDRIGSVCLAHFSGLWDETTIIQFLKSARILSGPMEDGVILLRICDWEGLQEEVKELFAMALAEISFLGINEILFYSTKDNHQNSVERIKRSLEIMSQEPPSIRYFAEVEPTLNKIHSLTDSEENLGALEVFLN